MEPMVPPLRHDGPIREVGTFPKSCAIEFEHEAKLLITTSDDQVKVWDGLSCELKKTIAGRFMSPLFFDRGLGGADSRRLRCRQGRHPLGPKALGPVATIPRAHPG